MFVLRGVSHEQPHMSSFKRNSACSGHDLEDFREADGDNGASISPYRKKRGELYRSGIQSVLIPPEVEGLMYISCPFFYIFFLLSQGFVFFVFFLYFFLT